MVSKACGKKRIRVLEIGSAFVRKCRFFTITSSNEIFSRHDWK